MEYSTKTRLPLHSTGIIHPSSLLRTPNWYNPFTLIYLYQWGGSLKRLTKSSFLEINAKGGERALAQSKRTAPPPISKFSIDIFWYVYLQEFF
jgi:hypothetical protein